MKGLHKWLIKLVVGKLPVVMNVRFPEGLTVGLEREVMVVSCSVHSRAEDCNLRYFCFINESRVSDVQA